MKPLSKRNHLNACKDLSACVQYWFINKIDPDPSFIRSFGNMEFKGNRVIFQESFLNETGPRPYDKCTLSIEVEFLVKSNGTLLRDLNICAQDHRGETIRIHKEWKNGIPLLQKIAKGEVTGWTAIDFDKFANPHYYDSTHLYIRNAYKLRRLKEKFAKQAEFD